MQAAFESLGLPSATQSYSYRLGRSHQVTRAHQSELRSSTDVDFVQNLTGINVYSILSAPKTDGAEALVLSASWLSRALDENGQRRINVRGIALVLALANYLKSRSLRLLVARDERLISCRVRHVVKGCCLSRFGWVHRGNASLVGFVPWTRSSQCVTLSLTCCSLLMAVADLGAEELSLATGPIWAALNLDYPHHSFSQVGMYFGQSSRRRCRRRSETD